MTAVADLVARLQELHARTAETPLFNPVFQLAHNLSRKLEAGELTLDDFDALIAELEVAALGARAARMTAMIGPVGEAENAAEFAASLDAPDFAAFAERWERPQLHAVFTAHPTFLLTPAQTAAVASAASNGSAIDPASIAGARPKITSTRVSPLRPCL